MRDTTENTPHRVVFRVSRDFPDRLISFPPALVCAGTANLSIAHPIISANRFRKSFPQIVSTNRFHKSFPQTVSTDRFRRSFQQIAPPSASLQLQEPRRSGFSPVIDILAAEFNSCA
jgi:hypothetical protein